MNDQQPKPLERPNPRPFQFGLRAMLVAITLLALFLGLIIVPLREAARRERCSNNLKQIGLALHNYHDVWKQLPPAVTLGPDGKPWHSWRVLLLPYLEQMPLYDLYQFDEPWDGPNNCKWHEVSLEFLLCPADPTRDATSTSYLLLIGPHTPWPGTETTGFRHILDGTSNTVAVIEVIDSGVHWMEPRDLDVEEFLARAGEGRAFDSRHKGGANVLFVDGSTHFMPRDLDLETLRRLVTRDDREPVDWSEIEE